MANGKSDRNTYIGLALVYATIAIIIGIVLLNKGPDGKPMCGGQAMRPGDVCESYRGSSQLPDISYNQAISSGKEADENRPTIAAWLIGSGLLVVSVCFLAIWKSADRRRHRPRSP